MQLIDTEIDIGVNSKMSTMQPESLEKFSLIDNVCSAITNGNDECTNDQEVVDEGERSFEKNEETSQCTESTQGPFINRENNVELMSGICDKVSEQNTDHSELRAENDENVREKKIKEKSLVNNLTEDARNSQNKNQTEIIEKSGKINIPDRCNTVPENIIEAQNKKVIIENKIDHLHEKNTAIDVTLNEDDIEEESSTEDKIRENNISDIDESNKLETGDKEIDVTFNEEKILNKNFTEDIIEEEFKENAISENKNEQENDEKDTEMNVIPEEEDKVKNSLTEDKTKDITKEDKDIEMKVIFEEEDKVNDGLLDDKIQDNDIEMEVTLQEEDKVTDSLIEDKTKEIVTDDKDIEMEVTFEEEDKVDNGLLEDKIKNAVNLENDVEMDVTLHEEDNVNDLLTTRNSEDNGKGSEIDHEIDNQNIDMGVESIRKEHGDQNIMVNKREDEGKVSSEIDKISEQQKEEDVQMDVINEEVENKQVDLHNEENESSGNIPAEEKHSPTQDKPEVQNKETNMLSNQQDNVNSEDNVKMDHSVSEENLETEKTSEKVLEAPGNRHTIERHAMGIDEIDNSENENKKNVDREVSAGYQDEVNVSSIGNINEDGEVKIDAKVNNETEEIVIQNEITDQDNIIANRDSIEESIENNLDSEDKCSTHIELNDKVETKSEINKNSLITEIPNEHADKECEIVDVVDAQNNDNLPLIKNIKQTHVQDKKESLIEGVVTEKSETYSKDKIEDHVPIIEPKDNKTTQVTEICEIVQQDRGYNEKVININQEVTKNESSDDKTNSNTQSDKKQVLEKHVDEHENTVKTSKSDENMDVEEKSALQNDDKESTNSFICKSNISRETEIGNDEVINIADEKDDEIDTSEIKMKTNNVDKMNTSVEKSSTDTQANQSLLKDTNIQEIKNNNSITQLGKKKTLTRVSKLANTLDIFSDDDEEDIQKNENEIQKDGTVLEEKQCTSINIDDDDDIMLIDEESNSVNDKNKANTLPESENKISPDKEDKVESKDVETKCSEVLENKKDTAKTETITPLVNDIETNESKLDTKADDEPSIPKKPLMQVNFLKTCAKNIADMTRDELEEFCILKIVESVIERSNLSEVKDQIKAMTQNVDEYKKRVSILARQNRDLQLVLKSVQEEQKKKSNVAITPLKVTRSVGMQVLMAGNARKKGSNANSNANTASKGKAQNQSKLQKLLTNTNPPPIPVPRLVPAVNSTNNGKAQSPNANTSKTQMPVSVTSAPIQNIANSPPVTPIAQKPEKRTHSRMQQNNSFTVDLTDDEPPAKVISRNVTPPVRLVPPQNLMAPNRQPFGTTINNPRKVYIPISGSQTPVGVRPGQTIMLKAISQQGPRQRVPSPNVMKPHQNPNTIRMQRMPASRHPAPLPDSVKQYQPANWKALPPAPELKLSKVDNGIVISWKIDGYLEENYEEIASYQLYAYQETSSPPSTTLWKKIGDVKALPLPMACTLTQFMAGFKYYFAVRAVDIRSRLGPFSLPGSILLLNKIALSPSDTITTMKHPFYRDSFYNRIGSLIIYFERKITFCKTGPYVTSLRSWVMYGLLIGPSRPFRDGKSKSITKKKAL